VIFHYQLQAVRLSQATSKVGRGLVAPALSFRGGQSRRRAQEAKSQGVKNLFSFSPDAGRAIGKKAVIRAAFQE
jgi:hypothetical protein